MSEELQSGDAAPEIEAAPAEDLNQGADLAPATEQEPELKPEVDEAAAAQAATQKVINEKHFQAKQAQRERDEYKAKLDKYETEQREAEAARVGEIPPIPDEFDDNFAEKMKARDEAVVQRANFNASQQAYQAQQQQIQQQTEQQRQIDTQQKVVAYSTRATELGIEPSELQAAGNAVMSYGMPDALAQEILADPDGPLITKHLAENASDVIAMANMSPVQQGAYLVGIKAKAGALKPKPSNTPKPPEQLSGQGVQTDASKYPNSEGAKYS